MESTDDIYDSIMIPKETLARIVSFKTRQDQERGDWPDPRTRPSTEPPWPGTDDPLFHYQVSLFEAVVAAGVDPKEAAMYLAIHAWFEGGAANYDRGQRDARASLSGTGTSATQE